MPGQIAPYLYTHPGSPVGDDITAINAPKGSIVFDETNGIVYQKISERGSNTDYAVINGEGAIDPSTKALAASITYDANVTPALITGFAWTVVAGATYVFDAEFATTMTTNAGLTLAFKLTTATLTRIRYNTYAATAADNGTAVSTTGTTTTDLTEPFNSKTAAYTRVRLFGSFVVNAGGTFSLYGCQETSGTTSDVTILLIGSTARVTRIA